MNHNTRMRTAHLTSIKSYYLSGLALINMACDDDDMFDYYMNRSLQCIKKYVFMKNFTERTLVMKKTYKEIDGVNCVAVLYSPGYGAGWYSWHNLEELLYDPEIVKIAEKMEVINKKWQDAYKRNDVAAKHSLGDQHQDLIEKVEKYAESKYPEDEQPYTGGVSSLCVAWLPEGTKFRIDEYDGSESIEIKEKVDWMVA